MPSYVYRCPDHGVFEVEKPMEMAARDEWCPECNGPTHRVFTSPSVVYACDGFYATDYTNDTGTGTKADRIRAQYERMTGEKAPPPAKDVPRNSRERI